MYLGLRDKHVTRQTDAPDACHPAFDKHEETVHLQSRREHFAPGGSAFALTTYALAKRLAKRPETANLAPYAEDMRACTEPRPEDQGQSGAAGHPNPTTTPSTSVVGLEG